jgi:PEP-CTERM motif
LIFCKKHSSTKTTPRNNTTKQHHKEKTMKTRIHQLALILALALPLTAANAQLDQRDFSTSILSPNAPATVGTVSLAFSPLSSGATSPGQSVTFTLQMTVAGFADPDRVGGYDITLVSSNSSTGFFIQSRTTAPFSAASPFSNPQTADATVAGTQLTPTEAFDLGASVQTFPTDNVTNGTFTLSTWVIGVNAGVAPGTYNFTTATNQWTDQNSGDHFDLGTGTFQIVVSAIPEPATWSLIMLGGLGAFGINLLRARRKG